MASKDSLSRFPDQVAASSKRAGPSYRRAKDRCAVAGPLPTDLESLVETRFPAEEVTVFRADPESVAEAVAGVSLLPVYRLESGGPPAVPTGRVFVVFSEDVRANDMEAQIGKAGYTIDSIPGYAPHSAWLRARSGRTSDALRSLFQLARVDGVQNVEPQMVTQRHYR